MRVLRNATILAVVFWAACWTYPVGPVIALLWVMTWPLREGRRLRLAAGAEKDGGGE